VYPLSVVAFQVPFYVPAVRKGTVFLSLIGPTIDARPISVSVQFTTSLSTEITTGRPLALRALPGYAIPTVSEKGSRFQRRGRHVGLHTRNG
jgi:hypothetical protein